ncbi:MAG: putative membrane protein YdjX (TVP38/TMEM64 family) [Lentisphaeria bacterium]|jgi:uncharacterized membrane protein YdjX (TVP38/TMEM64 family)
MTLKKWIVLALALSAAAAILYFDLLQSFSYDQFSAWVDREPLKSAISFALIYIAVASLSLPGVGPLSIIAGAVFGVWYGVLIVSFASSIGATLGMLVSRTLLQDWVKKRFATTIDKVNVGIALDGSQYLFTLRLIPPIPYFVINLVFGLTQIRVATFYIVSQLGMLPATFLYVNAGASLGTVEKFSFWQIFTPEIILSFAALIAFPFIVKALAKRFKKVDIAES